MRIFAVAEGRREREDQRAVAVLKPLENQPLLRLPFLPASAVGQGRSACNAASIMASILAPWEGTLVRWCDCLQLLLPPFKGLCPPLCELQACGLFRFLHHQSVHSV